MKANWKRGHRQNGQGSLGERTRDGIVSGSIMSFMRPLPLWRNDCPTYHNLQSFHQAWDPLISTKLGQGHPSSLPFLSSMSQGLEQPRVFWLDTHEIRGWEWQRKCAVSWNQKNVGFQEELSPSFYICLKL